MVAVAVAAASPLRRHPRVLAKILSTRGGVTSDEDEVKMFPALSEDEIAEKLNTIPVFGITDAKGQSVVHKMADGDLVSHVFLTKPLADEMLKQFKQLAETSAGETLGDKGTGLQVSDVPLGMLWSKLASPEDDESSGDGASSLPKTEEGASVQLRLMADPADLAIARNMTAGMVQQLAADGSGDEGGTEAMEEVEKAMASKVAKLQQDWGVVPVFTMYGMKIRVRESAEPDAKVKELLPWFLSIEECVKSSKKAAGVEEGKEETEEELKKLAGMSINMSTLSELAAAMAKESAVDFRSVIFMPSASVSFRSFAMAAGMFFLWSE